MLWEIDIHPLLSDPSSLGGALPDRRGSDREGNRVANEAASLGIADQLQVASARGFLVDFDRKATAANAHLETLRLEKGAQQLAGELFADTVVEQYVAAPVGDCRLTNPPDRFETGPYGKHEGKRDSQSGKPRKDNRPGDSTPSGAVRLIHVMPKAGVMDPVAQSAEAAVADFQIATRAIRTFKKYWISGASDQQLRELGERILANDAIEQILIGPLRLETLDLGSDYSFELKHIAISQLNNEDLMRLSREGQLYLQLAEMQTLQKHFLDRGREPTDIELETIAQTWSEHCSHKTLAGRIAYRDTQGERHFENMLKETIFAATRQLRQAWGPQDWCESVFQDNAGIVKFNDQYHVAFKVETHNHPSALEPYGGANTGIGGVIRDTMGTGMGAKPICNTDVFCFAPPDSIDGIDGVDGDGKERSSPSLLPPGVLHPKRVMRGVVEGVRDYGNRMGIPTVNGAVYFDHRYLGNPLVYCGNVGLIPHDMAFKEPVAGDLIVSVGGKTGRDGIHGATFSSAELTSESDTLSGGAVQIGNAIEEKMVLDVLLEARDRGLYHAVTDCGAGGFSSAVGEMGEKIGAEVWLERAPVKYAGLSYTEIWISEAQERMVLSVSEECWDALHKLCADEGVEASVIGRFTPTGQLTLKYNDQVVGELAMAFLHNGRPPVVREAVYMPVPAEQLSPRDQDAPHTPRDRTGKNHVGTLHRILGSLNVASKEWVIRQYDHEVQGGSVVKPLTGAASDGPSDAAIVRPVLDCRRGLVIACGMNPHYGDLDTYHMAASAIDEAVRNCVAVGADPSRIALLDNFCWGDCEKSETLGSLVRAAIACHDLSITLETPFISGKDSLNNEFSYVDDQGEQQTIAIPPTLLISAMGQINDSRRAVTMDLKQSDNLLYVVGETKEELGGSHWALVLGLRGGQVPTVDPLRAKATFAALHGAICSGLIRACHDLSEGGLAAAAAEMAFAGNLGAELRIGSMPVVEASLSSEARLFSESNSRFLCEIPPEHADQFELAMGGLPHAKLGKVIMDPHLTIREEPDGPALIEAPLADLKASWKEPFNW